MDFFCDLTIICFIDSFTVLVTIKDATFTLKPALFNIIIKIQLCLLG